MSSRVGEGGSLGDELNRRLKAMQQKVERASMDELNSSAYVEALRAHVPGPVVLLVDDCTKKWAEVDVMVPGFLEGQVKVRGERVRMKLPTSGPIALLGLTPSQSLMRRFSCVIEQDGLTFTYENRTIDPASFESWWSHELGVVRQQVGYLNSDIERFAALWPGHVDAAVAARKSRLEDQGRRRQALGA